MTKTTSSREAEKNQRETQEMTTTANTTEEGKTPTKHGRENNNEQYNAGDNTNEL